MRKTVNLLQACSFFLGLAVFGALAGCNKEPEFTPPSYSSAVINDFWLEKTQSNPTLSRPYQAMIVGDTAIRLTVDYGTDITALEPTIFSDADSIAPKGKQNFSSPVRYTVWANGKSATYTVRITASPVQHPVVKTIAAGSRHILSLKNDGTVWVCGDNSSGQLALGDYSSRNRLTQVPVYDAEQIFTGDAASVIRLKDGTAWGVGNQYGQLGLGHNNSLITLTRVPFLDDAVQVAITAGEVLALKPDGSVWGAGRNLFKTLAQGDAEPRASFVKIPISNVKQMSGNGFDIVVLKNNGELWGWGNNLAGQLGVGDKLPRLTPVLLPTPGINIAKVFAGGTTIFLIDNAGKIWGAGSNTLGQLGLGDQTNRTSFTQVPFFNNKSVDFIIPRTMCTGFKETNGTMWNVGDNVRGQMGLGTINGVPFTTPLQLAAFTASALAGTGSTSFALKTDGTLWAWGSNSSGALGVGKDTTDVSTPIQIK